MVSRAGLRCVLRKSAAWSWLSLALACGHVASSAPTIVAPPVAEHDPSWAAELRARGVPVLATGELSLVEGTGATLALPATGGCRALVVRATAGLRDVDAAIYDANGVLVSLDEAPDAHAAVPTCASGSAFARIDARAGAGEVTWVFVALSEEPLTELLTELGIEGGRAAPDEPWGQLDGLLRDRGFGLRSERWSAVADPRLPLTSPFELAPGRCMTLGIRAADQEVGARLVLERGVADVASVEADPAATALLQVCSHGEPLAGRLEVVVSAATTLSFARWEGRHADVGGDEGLWLGRRTSP